MGNNVKKLTWAEAVKYLTEFNKKHDIGSKGCSEARCTIVAVITQDSFSRPFTETERSYRFTNHNKAFIPSNISNSIFAECLDGTEPCVRLDWYVPEHWKAEYCYIESETDGSEDA